MTIATAPPSRRSHVIIRLRSRIMAIIDALLCVPITSSFVEPYFVW